MNGVEWVQREGYSLSSITNDCGVAIDDDRTGTWTTVRTQWRTTVRVAGPGPSTR